MSVFEITHSVPEFPMKKYNTTHFVAKRKLYKQSAPLVYHQFRYAVSRLLAPWYFHRFHFLHINTHIVSSVSHVQWVHKLLQTILCASYHCLIICELDIFQWLTTHEESLLNTILSNSLDHHHLSINRKQYCDNRQPCLTPFPIVAGSAFPSATLILLLLEACTICWSFLYRSSQHQSSSKFPSILSSALCGRFSRSQRNKRKQLGHVPSIFHITYVMLQSAPLLRILSWIQTATFRWSDLPSTALFTS